MLYDFTAFANIADQVEADPRLSALAHRYDEDTNSLTEDEVSEMVGRFMRIADEDYPQDDYYEDWDNLEMGFDPYMGSYSDDC